MKMNYLVFIVGILGLLFCGYFLMIGKDTTTSLIGFICGVSLIFFGVLLKKQTKSIK